MNSLGATVLGELPAASPVGEFRMNKQAYDAHECFFF